MQELTMRFRTHKFKLIFALSFGAIILWMAWNMIFSRKPQEKLPHYPETEMTKEIKKDRVMVNVAVYYEALCPDSKDFIVSVLPEMYEKLKDVVHLSFIPYGKAETRDIGSRRYTFKCQHGPKECDANKVHACVLDTISNSREALEVTKCMIEMNMRNGRYLETAKECVTKINRGSDWRTIEKCTETDKKDILLFHMGELTQTVASRLSFVPTVTINDVVQNYGEVELDFVKLVCRYSAAKENPHCQSRHINDI